MARNRSLYGKKDIFSFTLDAITRDSKMTKQTLDMHFDAIREYAKNKLQEGSEPPWMWYEYMKLVEAIDKIRAPCSYISLKKE